MRSLFLRVDTGFLLVRFYIYFFFLVSFLSFTRVVSDLRASNFLSLCEKVPKYDNKKILNYICDYQFDCWFMIIRHFFYKFF